ncbi:MAG: hypothetical protein ACTSRG_18435 [Candidatus Helarchaeota archaeon]
MVSKNRKTHFRMPYRISPKLPDISEYMEKNLTKGEVISYSRASSHTRYLKDLFLLNDLSFWDKLQLTKEQKVIFGRHTIKGIIKFKKLIFEVKL